MFICLFACHKTFCSGVTDYVFMEDIFSLQPVSYAIIELTINDLNSKKTINLLNLINHYRNKNYSNLLLFNIHEIYQRFYKLSCWLQTQMFAINLINR